MRKRIRIDGVELSYFPSEENLAELCEGFIYVTKCLTTNKFYVGKSNFQKTHDWRKYLGYGYDLRADIKAYGEKNFKRIIIDVAMNQFELKEKERKYIELFEAVDKQNWYNSPRKRRKNGLKTLEQIKKAW